MFVYTYVPVYIWTGCEGLSGVKSIYPISGVNIICSLQFFIVLYYNTDWLSHLWTNIVQKISYA
jgi:hypothetical protein